jgi:putative transcriptional regulator
MPCKQLYNFTSSRRSINQALSLLSLFLFINFSSTAIAESLSAGKYLIASNQLRGSYFYKTVILLTHYTEKEAAGLVINRSTQFNASVAIPEIQSLLDDDPLIFLGGPVATDTIRVLVRSSTPVKSALHVLDDLYYMDDQTIVSLMFSQKVPFKAYRFYAGYAGWGAGQLEAEVFHGSWHVLSAKDMAILETDPELLWPDLIQRFNGVWALK